MPLTKHPDIPQELIDESRSDPYVGNRLSFDPEFPVRTLMVGDTVAGFQLPGRIKRTGVPYTGSVYIAKAHRGKGLAAQALRRFLDDYPDSISYVNKSNVASQRAHRKAGWVNTNKPVPGNRNSTIWKRRDKMHKTASQIADSVLVKVALRREIKELRKGNLSASDISRLVANQDSAYPSPVLGEWVKIPPLF